MSKFLTYQDYKENCFYKLTSKARLFSLLFISQKKYSNLKAESDSLYKDFQQPKKEGGFRDVSAPRKDLKLIQKRIHKLLSKINPPDFLISPVKGRSYIDNASSHKNFDQLRKLDIVNYYPNCTGNRVIWFFHKYMKCSIDVAVTIKNLVTRNDSLPQGSPCSPILAFLCYCDMWNEINKIVRKKSCTLTLYVDDLTISGEQITGDMIWAIKKTINKFGHKTNTQKERSIIGKASEVTGVVINKSKLLLPNRQHKSLYELSRLDTKKMNAQELESIKNQIKGRLIQADQVKNNSSQD